MASPGIKAISYYGYTEYTSKWNPTLEKINTLLKLKCPTNYFRIGFDADTNPLLKQKYYKELELYRPSSDIVGVKYISDGKVKRIYWGRKYWWVYEYDGNVQKLLSKFFINRHESFTVHYKAKNVEIIKYYNQKTDSPDSDWKLSKQFSNNQKFFVVPLSIKQYQLFKKKKQPFIFLAGRSKDYTELPTTPSQ